MPIHGFGSGLREDFVFELRHLLHKFLPQLVIRDLNKVLQILFLLGRPDQGATISLWKEMSEKASDSVLRFNRL